MIDLDGLSRSELAALNREIVRRLKLMDAHSIAQDMIQFRPGDQVSFTAPSHGTLLARVMKLNRKTVTVLVDDGSSWNVSPHALTLVKDVKPNRPIIEGDSSSE